MSVEWVDACPTAASPRAPRSSRPSLSWPRCTSSCYSSWPGIGTVLISDYTISEVRACEALALYLDIDDLAAKQRTRLWRSCLQADRWPVCERFLQARVDVEDLIDARRVQDAPHRVSSHHDPQLSQALSCPVVRDHMVPYARRVAEGCQRHIGDDDGDSGTERGEKFDPEQCRASDIDFRREYNNFRAARSG